MKGKLTHSVTIRSNDCNNYINLALFKFNSNKHFNRRFGLVP